MKRFIKQCWLAGLLAAALLGLGGCDQPADPVPPQYTLTFDSGEGASPVEPVTAKEGTKVPQPADPARDDYTFQGWFDEGGEPCAWPHTLTADITLRARWQTTLPQYTLTFNTGEGASPVEPIRANEGTQAARPADPARDGHAFLGWFTGEGEPCAWPHTLTADATLYARWTPQYTLAFNTGEGASPIAPITANEGTEAAQPPDPVKAGHNFLGWFDTAEGGTPVQWPHTLTADVTLYAQWQARTHTLAFDSAGGSPVLPITANEGTAVPKPPDPARDSHTFLGWFDPAGSLHTWPHTLSAGITMYAHWQDAAAPPPPQYTLAFDTAGGSPVDPVIANAGTPIARPTNDPVKTGHTFDGWFDSAVGGTPVQWPHTLTADLTMYAHWTARYTLTFNPDGGSAIPAITADSGTPIPQPAPDPAKTGHTFSGWFTAANGGTPVQWPHTLTGNITLYARWTPQYTLTFNTNDGSTIPAITADSGTPIARPTPDPAKNGYTFSDWYDSAGGGNPVQWPHILTGNTTIYARWTAQNTLTFVSHGGPEIPPVTVNEGTPIDKPAPDPAKPGHTFDGWFTTANGENPVQWPQTLTGNRTIHARWTEDQTEEKLFTITGGGTGPLPRGSTRQFTVNPKYTVTWTVAGNTDSGTAVTTLSATLSRLKIGANEMSKTLIVKATSVENPQTFATITVTVADPLQPPTVWTELTDGLKGLITNRANGWKTFHIYADSASFGIRALAYGKGVGPGQGRWIIGGGSDHHPDEPYTNGGHFWPVVAYSDDDGDTWTEIQTTLLYEEATYSIIYDGPPDDKKFILSTGRGNVFWSYDGLAWTKFQQILPGYTVADSPDQIHQVIYGDIDANNGRGRYLALGAGGRFTWSDDGGKTWERHYADTDWRYVYTSEKDLYPGWDSSSIRYGTGIIGGNRVKMFFGTGQNYVQPGDYTETVNVYSLDGIDWVALEENKVAAVDFKPTATPGGANKSISWLDQTDTSALLFSPEVTEPYTYWGVEGTLTVEPEVNKHAEFVAYGNGKFLAVGLGRRLARTDAETARK
jgi:uncharacterized repeat protein (TIGR02543 family)